MIIEAIVNEYVDFKRLLGNLSWVFRQRLTFCTMLAVFSCQRGELYAQPLPELPGFSCDKMSVAAIRKEYPALENSELYLYRRDQLSTLLSKDAEAANKCFLNLCAKGDRAACVDVAYLEMQYGETTAVRDRGLANLEEACRKNEFPACYNAGVELRDRELPARALPYLSKVCKEENRMMTNYVCGFAAIEAEKLKNDAEAEAHWRLACDKSQFVGSCSGLANFYLKKGDRERARPLLYKQCFQYGDGQHCVELVKFLKLEKDKAELARVAIHTCQYHDFLQEQDITMIVQNLRGMGFKTQAETCLSSADDILTPCYPPVPNQTI